MTKYGTTGSDFSIMKKSLFVKFKNLPTESKGNAVTIHYLIAWLLTIILVAILGRKDVFKIDVGRWGVILALAIMGIVAAIVIIDHFKQGEVFASRKTKYFLMFLVCVASFAFCVKLFFHTTLLLVTPLLLSYVYRSKKFSLAVMASTAFMVICSPLLAYRFNGMGADFPLWFVSFLEPSYLSKVGMEEVITHVASPSSIIGKLLVFVSFPRFLIFIMLATLMLFSTELNRKSHERKISQVISMQDAILDGMSEVIENRDSFTGGHVKRTREAVEVLTGYARKYYKCSRQFWENVVQAAAMHDVGKISISDTILNKPARLSPEEFEQIKKHPQKSLEIIDAVLGKVESEDFLYVSRNIALYHHEKYDGTGYPVGLKGEDIPLEARIMAIADVFDALVSKRVYKEPFSFEESYNIIMKDMGTHFDPGLKEAFDKAYPELVEIYKRENERESVKEEYMD